MSDSTKIIKATQEEHDAAIALMRTFMCSDKPKVGVFWYDFVNNSLFGVEKGEVDIYLTNEDMATFPKTHKEYWDKQHDRAIAKNNTKSIFYNESNYSIIPKGSVYYEHGVYYAKVGNWINGEIEKLRELLIDEFDLPEDVIFRIDE